MTSDVLFLMSYTCMCLTLHCTAPSMGSKGSMELHTKVWNSHLVSFLWLFGMAEQDSNSYTHTENNKPNSLNYSAENSSEIIYHHQ